MVFTVCLKTTFYNKKCMADQKTLQIPPKNFAFFTLTKAHKTLIKQPKNSKNYFFIFWDQFSDTV